MDRPGAKDFFALTVLSSNNDSLLVPSPSVPLAVASPATVAKLTSINSPRPVPPPVTTKPGAHVSYSIQYRLPPVELPAAALSVPAAPPLPDSPRSAAPPPPPSNRSRTDVEKYKRTVTEKHDFRNVLTQAKVVLACLVRRLEERDDATGPTYPWKDLALDPPAYFPVPPDWIVHRKATLLLKRLPKLAAHSRYEATFVLQMTSMWPKLNDEERMAVYDHLKRFSQSYDLRKYSPYRCCTERRRHESNVRRERRPDEGSWSRSRSRSTGRRSTEWERPSHRGQWERRTYQDTD